jgi:voltage-gated potassium channel
MSGGVGGSVTELHATYRAVARTRSFFYDLLEARSQSARLGVSINRAIGSLIVISVGATILDSVPRLRAQYGDLFTGVEILSLAAFSIEYILRVWIAPEHTPYSRSRAAAARAAYIVSPQGIIDFLAVAPLWIALAGFHDLRIFVILRILRVFKFARYSSGMRSLLEVLASERRALGGCLVILLCATLVSATAMHLVEGEVQPDKFGTIPDAMWWAIVTLSTIGYGDVVPSTALGRVVASGTIVAGLIMIALPVGIVATAFSEVIHRRDFIVTWSMVARVPLFAHLTAGDIAHITRLLRARQVERGEIIVRRGEPAHSMYFVTEGEVEIEAGPDQKRHQIRLGAGHFFGERAILKERTRSSTVRSIIRSKLLVLDAADFKALIAQEATIAQHVHKVAHERRRLNVEIEDGDIASEEVASGEVG